MHISINWITYQWYFPPHASKPTNMGFLPRGIQSISQGSQASQSWLCFMPTPLCARLMRWKPWPRTLSRLWQTIKPRRKLCSSEANHPGAIFGPVAIIWKASPTKETVWIRFGYHVEQLPFRLGLAGLNITCVHACMHAFMHIISKSSSAVSRL